MNTEKTKNKLKKIGEEFDGWQEFLEQVIGIAAFSFALSSAGLQNPFLSLVASFLSLVILNSVIDINQDKFSQTFKDIRDKKNKTRFDVAIIGCIKIKHLNSKKYSVYFIGAYSLLAVFVFSLIRIFCLGIKCL